MIKVLLADDENLELELLSDNIDWYRYGFEICATAKNGKDALEKTAKFHPQVIITDIKMPVIDGVELSQKIRELYPDIEIVFLSGYDQFDYLKNAINVNAIDYILKPVIVEEIPDLLVKIKNRISSKVSVNSYKDKAIHSIQQLYQKSLIDEASSYGFIVVFFNKDSTDDEIYLMLIFIDELGYLVSKYGDSVLDEKDNYILNYVNELNGIMIKLNNSLYLALGNRPFSKPISTDFISVSSYNEKTKISSILETVFRYELLYNSTKMYTMPGYVVSNHIEATNRLSNAPSLNELLLFIQRKSDKQIKTWLNEYYYSQEIGKSSFYELPVKLINYVFTNIPELDNPNISASKAIYIKELSSIRSIPLLIAETDNMINNVIEYCDSNNLNYQDKIAEEVKNYIDCNYEKPLSIDTIADYFNYSPSHISAIFKKYANSTVMNYLTDYRLYQSTLLLKNTNLKVNQISEKVGYPNSSYYCSIFAKKYGTTPKQFRMRSRNDKK